MTRESNPSADNADVLDISVITGCRTDIDESRTELKMETRDNEGKPVRRSYNPPRYEYDYDFYIILSVNTPYFSEMKFKLNDSRVHIPYQSTTIRLIGGSLLPDRREDPLYDPCYRGFKESCDEICSLLNQISSDAVGRQQTGASAQNNLSIETLIPGISSSPAAKKAVEEVLEITTWRCASCGCLNNNTLSCQQCGASFSDEEVLTNLKNLAFAAAMGENAAQINAAMPNGGTPVQNNAATQSWLCPCCGAQNSGKFCESCGAKRP